MITTQQAIDMIIDNAKCNNTYEEVYVSDCLDRIAYETITSKIDIPTFTRSSMDGYAIAFFSTNRYKIVEEPSELKPGFCMRVNTGFPIPKNADAVVEVEKTKIENGHIIIEGNINPERNFTKKGTELKKGDILLKKQEKISIRKRALLAYAGIVTLKVYRKPIVGIITTGDEVVFPSCETPPNSIFNSNFFILDGLIKKWGGEAVYFGHIPDDQDIFKKKLLYALHRCDVVLTTGGVSKGTKDYTKSILQKIKAEIVFERTTIKPGKPATFAIHQDKFIFSLPGWPAALYTTAIIYLKPFFLKIAGNSNYKNTFFNGIIDENMHSQKNKDYFNRIKITYKKDKFHLTNSGSQKTDNYFSLANADGLVWIDFNKEDEIKGRALPFIIFDD